MNVIADLRRITTWLVEQWVSEKTQLGGLLTRILLVFRAPHALVKPALEASATYADK